MVSGGAARNVVPDRCTVVGEVRSLDHDRCATEAAAMIEAATVSAAETGCGVDVDVRGALSRLPVSTTSTAYRLAVTALEASGYWPYDRSTGGGADTHVFNERGLECVNLCSGMERIHTPEEYIDVADVEGLSRLTVELIRGAAGMQS